MLAAHRAAIKRPARDTTTRTGRRERVSEDTLTSVNYLLDDVIS